MNEFKSMGDFIFEGREPDLRVPPPHFLIEMLRPPYLLYANEFEVSATFNMNGYRPMIRTNKNNIVGVRCAFYSEGVARLLTAE